MICRMINELCVSLNQQYPPPSYNNTINTTVHTHKHRVILLILLFILLILHVVNDKPSHINIQLTPIGEGPVPAYQDSKFQRVWLRGIPYKIYIYICIYIYIYVYMYINIYIYIYNSSEYRARLRPAKAPALGSWASGHSAPGRGGSDESENWQLPNGVRTNVFVAEVLQYTIIYVRTFLDKIDTWTDRAFKGFAANAQYYLNASGGRSGRGGRQGPGYERDIYTYLPINDYSF